MGFHALSNQKGIGQAPIQDNLHDRPLKIGEFIRGSEGLIDPYGVPNHKGYVNGFEGKFHT